MLTTLEKDYLRSVAALSGALIGGATLAAVSKDLQWTAEEFKTMTERLHYYGYILVRANLTELTRMGLFMIEQIDPPEIE